MKRPNIILIVLDTLRADILEAYGGEAGTPNLRRLAKDAVTYGNAIAPSPWTVPSHTSLFTGLYASRHGVHELKGKKLSDVFMLNGRSSAGTIAENLNGMGYNTLGISNSPNVSKYANFDKGFDSFRNFTTDPWLENEAAREARRIDLSPLEIAKVLINEERWGDIPRYAKEFIKVRIKALANNFPIDKGATLTNKILFSTKLKSDFFLFINLFEMHEPYRGANLRDRWEHAAGIKSLGSREIARLKRQYIMEAEYLDQRLGELMGELRSRGIYDDALIVITSDHGQAFNEHGHMYHGSFLYDEIVRVPLIIKYPKNRKFIKRTGYQSLANVPDLIMDIIEGKDDRRLTTEKAFAESYDACNWYSLLPRSYIKRQRDYLKARYEKVRKAVFKGDFKLTVNGTDGKVEEFLRNGKTADQSRYRENMKELLKELRDFNIERDFLIPGS